MLEKYCKTIIHSLFFIDYFLIAFFLSAFSFTISLTYASILATIFAIIFSISVLAIQYISQNYSYKVLDYYKNDKITIGTLGIFLSGISVIIIYNIVYPNYPFFNFLSIFLVFCALHMLLIYFDQILKIINPIQLSEQLFDRGKKSLIKNSSKDLREIISLLGDISLKSLMKKETSSTKEYLKILYELNKECIVLYKQNPQSEHFLKKTGEMGNYLYIDNIFSAISDENIRIFKQSIDQNEIGINQEIYKNHTNLIAHSLPEPEVVFSDQLSPNIKIFEISVNSRDSARFVYLNLLVGIFSVVGYKPSKKDNIRNLILNFYKSLNVKIFQHDDFDLFKSEINDFSLQLIDSPNHIQKKLSDDLYFIEETRSIPMLLYYDQEFSQELSQRVTELRYFMELTVPENFDKIFEYQDHVIELVKFIIQHLESEKIRFDSTNQPQISAEIQECIVKLNERYGNKNREFALDILDFFKNALLFQTFFEIGAILLYQQNTKDFNAEIYIKELWEHTHPEDADAHSLNTTPVTFNARWLTNLLLYHEKSYHSFKRNFSLGIEDFHGVTSYVYLYYLLCIVRSIQKNESSLNFIPKTDILKMKRENPEVLNKEYAFVTQFLFEKERLEQYQKNLSEQSGKFNILFKGKAEESIAHLTEWINKTISECEAQEKEITAVLDLDPQKIENAKRDIISSYTRSSQIDKIFKTTRYDPSDDGELSFEKIEYRPLTPKHCLISPSHVMCDVVWKSHGRTISNGEIKYIYDTLNTSSEIDVLNYNFTTIEKLYQTLKNEIETLKSNGFDPKTIFIPLDIKTEFRLLLIRSPAEFSDWSIFQRFNIIHSWKGHEFDNIIIIDQNAGQWIYKTMPSSNERLFTEITEYPVDPLNVDCTISTIFSFKMLNPRGIKIIKISDFQKKESEQVRENS